MTIGDAEAPEARRDDSEPPCDSAAADGVEDAGRAKEKGEAAAATAGPATDDDWPPVECQETTSYRGSSRMNQCTT